MNEMVNDSSVVVRLTCDELDLLCYGFGYFIQEFPHSDDGPGKALMDKLYVLCNEHGSDMSSEVV